MIDKAELREWITNQAVLLGFDAVGFAPVISPPHTFASFNHWLADGFHGTMSYLPRGRDRRQNPQLIQNGAHSYISVAMNYFCDTPSSEQRADLSRGQIAIYACGRDYHEIMLPKLKELGKRLDNRTGAHSRAYVDTGALLEREIAATSGLGFIGKNTCLINPRKGSYFLLGELITTAELTETTSAIPESKCGTCVRCLNKCPTGAIIEPYRIDSRRCISYLTIEYRGEIPVELRPLMKNWVFGCDDCQTCCPWNRFSTPAHNANYQLSERFTPKLLDLYRMSDSDFRERFDDSPILRPGRDVFLRSVAIALTNWGSVEARDALTEMVCDSSDLVKSHARWGLTHINGLTKSFNHPNR